MKQIYTFLRGWKRTSRHRGREKLSVSTFSRLLFAFGKILIKHEKFVQQPRKRSKRFMTKSTAKKFFSSFPVVCEVVRWKKFPNCDCRGTVRNGIECWASVIENLKKFVEFAVSRMAQPITSSMTLQSRLVFAPFTKQKLPVKARTPKKHQTGKMISPLKHFLFLKISRPPPQKLIFELLRKAKSQSREMNETLDASQLQPTDEQSETVASKKKKLPAFQVHGTLSLPGFCGGGKKVFR
jgi:hypothetical protein